MRDTREVQNPSTSNGTTFSGGASYNRQINPKETEAALRLLSSQVPKLVLDTCTIPLTADSSGFGSWAQWLDAVEEATLTTAADMAMGPLTRFVHGLTEGTVVAPLVKSAMRSAAAADGLASALWRAVVAPSVPWERRGVILRKAEWAPMARSIGHETAVENLFEALYEDLQRQAPMTDVQLRAMLSGLTRELGFSDQEVHIAGVLPVVSEIYETCAGATAGSQFWVAVRTPLWQAVRKAAAAYREFLRVLGTDGDVSGSRWTAYVLPMSAKCASTARRLLRLQSRAGCGRTGCGRILPSHQWYPRVVPCWGGQSRKSRSSRGMGANVAQDVQHEVVEIDGGRATYRWHGETYELPRLVDYRDDRDLHRAEYLRF